MKHCIGILLAVVAGLAAADTRFNPLNVKRVEGVVGVTHDELRAAIREEDTALRTDLVPKTTEVNGHALSGDITLTPADVQALPLAGGTMDDEAEITLQTEADTQGGRAVVKVTPLGIDIYELVRGTTLTYLASFGNEITLYGGNLTVRNPSGTLGGHETIYANGEIQLTTSGSTTGRLTLPNKIGTLATTEECNGSITVKKKTVNNQNEISGETSTVYTPSTAKTLTTDELGALNAVTGGVVNGLFPRFTHVNPALSVGWSTFHDMQSFDPLEPTTTQPVMFSAGASIHTKAQNTITLGWGVNNTNNYSFVWSGDADRYYSPTAYADSSYGTRFNGGFHINPKVRSGMTTPLENFWVGDQHLKAWIEQLAPVDHTSTRFSNEVLSVGLNLDPAVLAEVKTIADLFGTFPVEGTATTLGGLLAALAVAIFWIRKTKQDQLFVFHPGGETRVLVPNGANKDVQKKFIADNPDFALSFESQGGDTWKVTASGYDTTKYRIADTYYMGPDPVANKKSLYVTLCDADDHVLAYMISAVGTISNVGDEVDLEPAENSDALVTSGGVYRAIQNNPSMLYDPETDEYYQMIEK